MAKILHKDLSFAVNGCIFDVHNDVGPGVREESYQKAVAICLANRGLPFLAKPRTRRELIHRGEVADVFEPDLVVGDRLILELKAQREGLNRINFMQTLNYVKFWDFSLGLSRARLGGRPDLQTPFFTNLLQKQGYRTGMAGKWFVGNVFDPPRRGLDEACIMVNGYRHWAPDIMVFGSGGLFRELNQPAVEGRLNEWEIPLEGDVRHKATCLPERYSDDVQVEFLADFIGRHRDRPFFAYYSSKLAHVPHAPTPDGDAEVIDVYRKGFQYDHGRDLKELQPFVQAEAKRRNLRIGSHDSYRAKAIHYLDKSVGRLLDQLERLGLRENTMVLFLSDNGNSGIDPLTDDTQRLPGRKGDSREGGTRIPLVVRWPAKIAARSRCDDLVHVQDFLPTLVELAGGTIDAHAYDGRSFAPQLLGRKSSPRTYFVGTGAHPSRWLDRVREEVGDADLKPWNMVWARGLRYKLYDDGRFYDLENDLAEEHTIPAGQGSAEAEAARKELQAVLGKLAKR